MMHVDPKPEPVDFDSGVRAPGNQFLAATPNPTTEQWASRDYWTRVGGEMHKCYSGICMYSCHWIPYDTGSRTIEHFKPKNAYPSEAYEWSNYRLVCGTLNGRKSKHEDVLDPFVVKNGMFVIAFTSMLVKPSRSNSITSSDRAAVQATIDRLGLNDEGTCLKARCNFVNLYCQGHVDFEYLEKDAPFIAHELKRQGLKSKIKAMWLS